MNERRLLEISGNRDRPHEVRKTAVFWLGRSDDPRVIGFFEEVLLGKN